MCERLKLCNLADPKYELVKMGKASSVSKMMIHICDSFHVSLVLYYNVLMFLRPKHLFPVNIKILIIIMSNLRISHESFQ